MATYLHPYVSTQQQSPTRYANELDCINARLAAINARLEATNTQLEATSAPLSHLTMAIHNLTNQFYTEPTTPFSDNHHLPIIIPPPPIPQISPIVTSSNTRIKATSVPLEAFIRRYDADQDQFNKQFDQIFAKLEKLTTHFHQRTPQITSTIQPPANQSSIPNLTTQLQPGIDKIATGIQPQESTLEAKICESLLANNLVSKSANHISTLQPPFPSNTTPAQPPPNTNSDLLLPQLPFPPPTVVPRKEQQQSGFILETPICHSSDHTPTETAPFVIADHHRDLRPEAPRRNAAEPDLRLYLLQLPWSPDAYTVQPDLLSTMFRRRSRPGRRRTQSRTDPPFTASRMRRPRSLDPIRRYHSFRPPDPFLRPRRFLRLRRRRRRRWVYIWLYYIYQYIPVI